MDRITFVVEKGPTGHLHLTSPERPELLVSGASLAEAMAAAPVVLDAIDAAHARNQPVGKS